MATSISAATASAVGSVGTGNAAQFQSLFDVIPFVVSLLDTSIPAGAAQADITVTGAELGDFVFITSRVDAVDAYLTGFVSAANTVTVAIVTGQHVDATTTFATTAKKCNGFILKPKGDFAAL